ncbi:hypothetical protein G3M48_008505 [Beauveria asiatica]|uniref:Uncharacterized protein n=1 Tax=Beauveria asiatica TaxID=1069075 RepID=A0AAW0RK94_9HYPO
MKNLEDVVRTALAQEARWVSPVTIGGWNIVFCLGVWGVKVTGSASSAKSSFSVTAHKRLHPLPTLISPGQHADLGHYFILGFIENTGLLSRASAKPNEDTAEAPVLNTAMASGELEAHLYDVAVHLWRLCRPSFP